MEDRLKTIGLVKGLWVLLALLLLISLPASAMSRAARKRPGSAPEEYVPALIRALQQEDYTVRRDAARALGRIGPAAGTALPALSCATQDSVDCVRGAAREALDRIELSLHRKAERTP